jgi:drug/metabolite transporter (DMT)-like permease
VLYYIALRQTPATRATLAELAFPVTAAAVGVTWLDGRLDLSQWAGFVIVLVSVVLLALHEHWAKRPVVAVSDSVEDALATRSNPAGVA